MLSRSPNSHRGANKFLVFAFAWDGYPPCLLRDYHITCNGRIDWGINKIVCQIIPVLCTTWAQEPAVAHVGLHRASDSIKGFNLIVMVLMGPPGEANNCVTVHKHITILYIMHIMIDTVSNKLWLKAWNKMWQLPGRKKITHTQRNTLMLPSCSLRGNRAIMLHVSHRALACMSIIHVT